MRPVELFALERLVARWVRDRSPAAVILVCLAFTVSVGGADLAVARAVGYDFVVTVLYLLPVGVAAWAVGQRAGFFLAATAAAVEAMVTWVAARGTLAASHLSVAILLELLVFLGAAHLLALLRQYLEWEREMSRTDPISGSGNSRSFQEVAQREIGRCQRTALPLSLAYFDVDDFKSVNDRHGHAAGDAVLRMVAEAMRGGVRSIDFTARVGGDEFVLLLPEAGADAARQVVERLRGRIGDAARAAGRGVTVSVGVVTFLRPPASVDEMLALADEAMYAAKHGGKNEARYLVHGGASLPAAQRAADAPIPRAAESP